MFPEGGGGQTSAMAAQIIPHKFLQTFPRQLPRQLAQLAEHALRKRMVMGSIPIGEYIANQGKATMARVAEQS